MRYLRPFGLSDNPFKPGRFGQVQRKFMDNLISKPIRVHLDAGLKALYVENAGPFQRHLASFRELLDEADYTVVNGGLGGQSIAVLVTGPKGTGKTSLTCAMIAEVLAMASVGLAARDVHFKEMGSDPDAFAKETIGLVRGHGQADTLCPLVIGGVSAKTIDALSTLYGDLMDERTMLMILESDDHALYDDPTAPQVAADVIRFDTDFMTADEAKHYVATRIGAFRDKNYQQHLASVPYFPFRDSDIVGVGPRATATSNGDSSGQTGLRQLNKLLAPALRRAVSTFPEDFDILQVPPAELDEHAINLGDAFTRLLPAELTA